MKTIKYACTENVIVGIIGEGGGIILFSPFTCLLSDLKPSAKFDIEGESITLTKLKKLLDEHTRRKS